MSTQGTRAGAFLPTTFIWDAAELDDINLSNDKLKDLLVRLYQNLNLMQLSLNIKDSAFYDETEFVNGQSFFPNPSSGSYTNETLNRRQVFRKVILFGALPNTGTKSVAHNLTVTSGYTFTRVYGCASDTTNLLYVPIPNANPDIHINLTSTNIVITTSANYSSYDTTYVILEYLKQ